MKLILLPILILLSFSALAQNGWQQCQSPAFVRRVDDIFMVNNELGYAVCGDGQIVRTVNGGNNWVRLTRDSTVYCRSVKFTSASTGFVGAFGLNNNTSNILRHTSDSGRTWTDISNRLPARALKGICGLFAVNSQVIYGCGNWYQDTGYIVRSEDGGANWTLINMAPWTSSVIDMYFINRDTGFAAGRGPAPQKYAVILYTTNGGITWTKKYEHTLAQESYCWKIQRLNNNHYTASISVATGISNLPRIIMSNDGGQNWSTRVLTVQSTPVGYDVQGAGFIDTQRGWAGGGDYTFFTINGGITWDTTSACPLLNRFLRVNDSVAFGTGIGIWKFTGRGSITPVPPRDTVVPGISMRAFPNPVKGILNIEIGLKQSTRVVLTLNHSNGQRVTTIDNSDRRAGIIKYSFETSRLSSGVYYLVLKTHDDQVAQQVLVQH
jgi:photosystem II stability/assembly factor-like uncharacterized protein